MVQKNNLTRSMIAFGKCFFIVTGNRQKGFEIFDLPNKYSAYGNYKCMVK